MASAMLLAVKTRIAVKLTRKLYRAPPATPAEAPPPAARARRPLPLLARVPRGARVVASAVDARPACPRVEAARPPAPRRRPFPEGARVAVGAAATPASAAAAAAAARRPPPRVPA